MSTHQTIEARIRDLRVPDRIQRTGRGRISRSQAIPNNRTVTCLAELPIDHDVLDDPGRRCHDSCEGNILRLLGDS